MSARAGHPSIAGSLVAARGLAVLACALAAACSDTASPDPEPKAAVPPLPDVVDLSWAATAATAEAFFAPPFLEVDGEGQGADAGFVTAKGGMLHLGTPGDWARAVVRTERTFDTAVQDVTLEVVWQPKECAVGYGPAIGLSDGQWSAYLTLTGTAWQFPLLEPGKPWFAYPVRPMPCVPGQKSSFSLRFREGGGVRVTTLDGTQSLGYLPVPARAKLYAFIANHSNGEVVVERLTVRAPAAVADAPRHLQAIATPDGVQVAWQQGKLHGADVTALRWLDAVDGGEEKLQQDVLPVVSPVSLRVSGQGLHRVRLVAITAAGPSPASQPIAVLPWQKAAAAPVLVDVAVAGSGHAGEALRASAGLVDANGDPLPQVAWRWQSAVGPEGPWSDVPGQTAPHALPSAAAVGAWWRALASATGATEVASQGVKILPVVDALYHVLVTGQSLSNGTGGSPALSTTQPYANLGWVGDALAPLVETGVESPGSGLGNGLTLAHAPTPFQVAVTRHGMDAIPYWGLAKGSQPYALGQAQLQAVVARAGQDARPYAPLGVVAIHGESDSGGHASYYASFLREWQEDYEADMAVATGVERPLPMFICQLSQATHTKVPLQQSAAARESDGRIVLVGPKYMLDYSWNWHLDAPSYRRLGEYHAKVIRHVAVAGLPWRPVEPLSVVRSGADIDVTFHVPVPPLVFDTTQVLAAAHQGFTFADDTSSAQIASVELVGPDRVRIHLDQVPTGANPTLAYALNGTAGADAGAHSPQSARGNVRDSDPTVLGSGLPLQNWAIHFRELVTSAQP